MLFPIDHTHAASVAHIANAPSETSLPRYQYVDASDRSWIGLFLDAPIDPVPPPVPPEPSSPQTKINTTPLTQAEHKAAYNLAGVKALEDILRRQFPALDVAAELVGNPGSSTTVQVIVHVTDPFGRTMDLVAKYVPDVPFYDYHQPPMMWRNGRVVQLMQEAAMLQAAGDRGIAPEVYRIDPDFGYFLQAYIPSTRPSDELFMSPVWQRRIAELTAQVHALEPTLPTPLDKQAYPRVEQYRLDALTRLGCLSARGVRLVNEYITILKGIGQVLPQVQRTIHGDLQPGNFLHANEDGRIYLIDFEQTSITDPMADVAFYLSETPEVESITRALEAYGSMGGETGAMAYERLCLHILLLQTRGLDGALRDEHGQMGPKTTASLQNMRDGLALFATAPGFESSISLQLRHRQAQNKLAELSRAIACGPLSH